MAPTYISVVNIGGRKIHSSFDIKPGVRLLRKVKFKEQVVRSKLVITNKFSMVSRDLLFKINARSLETFVCSTVTESTWLAVALVANLLQLPTVMDRLVYATVDGFDALERYLVLNLWRMFQFDELIRHLALTLCRMLRIS